MKSDGHSPVGADGPSRARLDAEAAGEGSLVVRLSGDWLLGSGVPAFTQIERSIRAGSARRLEFEAAALGRWNSALMVFLSKCADLCRDRGVEMDTSGLPPGAANLLRLARTAADTRAPASGARSPAWLELVGGGVLAFAGGA
ncbi:MAG TPA: hypothetical protein PK640_15990, partial [Verrucomicrobiota bacterium]|nr:hypothetical protein [Verrucomicrobiota bacterium]